MATDIKVSGAQWGGITGTLSNQTDLQTTLNTLSAIDRGRRGFSFFTDFLGNPAVSIDGLLQNTSVGTISTTIGISGRTQSTTGAATYTTGASVTGFSYHISNTVAQLFFSGGLMVFETFVSLDQLSTYGTEVFRTIHGFASGIGNSNEVNGVFFTYDPSGTANGTVIGVDQWRCISVRAGVRTLTNTTVTPNAAQFYKLRIEVNAAGTSAAFYINGTLVATHTTNIPQYFSSQFVFAKNGINKALGSASVAMYADYLGYENILTTPR